MQLWLLAQDSVITHSNATDPWTLINVLLSAIGAGLVSLGAFVRWQLVKWNERADKEQVIREVESQARMVEDKRRTECLESLVAVSSKIVDAINQQEEKTRRAWTHAAQAFDAISRENTAAIKEAADQLRMVVEK